MYSGWSFPDTPRSYPTHERNATVSNGHSHGYAQPHTATLPPRPLEPRPTLQTSLSEPSVLSRSQEPYRYADGPTTEYRARSQNLPGLKDILNSTSYPSSHQTYGSSWNTSTGPSNTHPDNEGYHTLNGIHPPMVLHPPTTANHGYQPQLDKPYELPITEPNRPSQAAVSSPRSGFPEAGRDHPEQTAERPKHPSTGSLLSNGVLSPYHSSFPEESQHQTQPTGAFRQGRNAHVIAGAESHGKYLGVEEVPGEGNFHVYADGYRIPTLVDGEQVNPAWGLTKANKPRKRLALACLDCREKKIKCDPGTNSCIQCEKAMRPCRRPPEKYSSTDTATNTMWVAGSPVRKSAAGSDTTPSSNRDAELDPMSKRRTRADISPPLGSNKRPRSNSPRPDRAQDLDTLRREETLSAGVAPSNTTRDAQNEPLMWENDPYAIDPDVTIHLVNLYFTHMNNATHCIFPRKHFMSWLKNYSGKCQNEKMLLYAMLAAASIHADSNLAGYGKQCARIVRDAIASEAGRFNVTGAQSKLLLALYHFAKGADMLAWEYVGSAIRTVTYMNLNTEDGCKDDAVSRSQARFEFDFSPEQLAECKRRTFWSCFLQERYGEPTMCTLKPEDIFTRLPCTDDMYEESIPSDAPYFTNDIADPVSTPIYPTSPLASMAWLILLAGMWGEIIDFGFRASHRPSPTYKEFYESFHARMQTRFRDWLMRVPKHLQYTEANLDRSIQEGYVGTFVLVHTLYHLSQIKLNRYMRHAVNPESVSRNIRTANHHGHQILQIMTALNLARREISTPAEDQPNICAFSTPFPGYAILSAIDIVSAGGLDSNLRATLDEIDGSLGCLRELEQYWNSAKDQLKACQKRFYQLKNVTISPKNAKSGCWLGRKWGIKTPLEQDFTPENDCIYGLGEQDGDEDQIKYFDAFNED